MVYPLLSILVLWLRQIDVHFTCLEFPKILNSYRNIIFNIGVKFVELPLARSVLGYFMHEHVHIIFL